MCFFRFRLFSTLCLFLDVSTSFLGCEAKNWSTMLFKYVKKEIENNTWARVDMESLLECLARCGFFSVLAAIIRKNFDKRLWINKNGEGFAVCSSTWPSGAKGEWRVSSWLAISNTREKNIVFFHVCCYHFSQSWKSLYNSVLYMIKKV